MMNLRRLALVTALAAPSLISCRIVLDDSGDDDGPPTWSVDAGGGPDADYWGSPDADYWGSPDAAPWEPRDDGGWGSPDARRGVDAMDLDGGDWGIPDAGPWGDIDAGGPPDGPALCGELRDVGDDRLITAATPSPFECYSWGGAATGPCALEIQAYDALELVSDPRGAQPLFIGYSAINRDGTFCLYNVEATALGQVALVVDDHPGADADAHLPTAIAFGVPAGSGVEGLQAYATAASTQQAWSVTAGLSGANFFDRGVSLHLFRRAGAPVVGVTVTAGGATQPAGDFYFADNIVGSRTTINPGRTTTGGNGSALLTGTSLVEHSGVGGLPAGCSWSSSLAFSTPGLIFVHPVDAVCP